MLYYVNDPSLRAVRNAAGDDYTPAYIPAMLAFMGMTGREIAPDELPTLTADDVVLVGSSELPMTDATVILMGTQPTALARKRQNYGYYTAQNG